MAIERELSKLQIRVFAALVAQQRQELQRVFEEIAETQQEQIEMLRVKYALPEGEYQVRQERTGEVFLFAVQPATDLPEAE